MEKEEIIMQIHKTDKPMNREEFREFIKYMCKHAKPKTKDDYWEETIIFAIAEK